MAADCVSLACDEASPPRSSGIVRLSWSLLSVGDHALEVIYHVYFMLFITLMKCRESL